MPNVFTDYPPVPWKQGWRFSAGPEDASPLFTQAGAGQISTQNAPWTLQLIQPSPQLSTHLLSNGLSVRVRQNRKQLGVAAVLTEPGILSGETQNLPPPVLTTDEELCREGDVSWVKSGSRIALLLTRDSRFAFVTGERTRELALLKAEEQLEEDFGTLRQRETERRQRTITLFSINPRHNPPVAIATESLRQRLRGRTAALHGTWSAADGFETETFSLNELYPLVEAWLLTDPDIATQLVQTALDLQQPSGGFPAWVDREGTVASGTPWPMLIQSFERAWQGKPDPVLLKKTLPALRKYIQWALRYFDPHRDQIPAWQSEQEIFVPDSFERNKATPDLTVMLIGELEALIRLCGQSETAATATAPLSAARDQLAHTLTSVFWNPEDRAFSNAWKDGHTLHQPSFASFLPLIWSNLPTGQQGALLDNFEETHGFPGHGNPADWNQEQIDDTAHLPAIHQFMALQALRRADQRRSLLMLFVRRARNGFSAWFERESISAARTKNKTPPGDAPAYGLGPVTAALLLGVQTEFRRDTEGHAPTVQSARKWFHRMRLTTTDLKIVLAVLLATGIIHLFYQLPKETIGNARMEEAALSYSQGRFSEALQICRQHPEQPLSRFLQANLHMLTDNPADAEPLYRQALLSETASPSALFGYALSLQMNGQFDEAVKRYNDFIDIYQYELDEPIMETAYRFLRLAEEKFRNPPKWKRVYAMPIMNDLGL